MPQCPAVVRLTNADADADANANANAMTSVVWGRTGLEM